MEAIYMDHNATTPLRAEVREAMSPYLNEVFGNASSIHTCGRAAAKGINRAREQVAEALGCRPEEVVFTGGGTEADNQAIKGVACALREKGNHIITTQIEHHAVLHTCQYLEMQGFQVTYLPVDEYGMVDPHNVRRAINDHTILISVMHANNEVGTVQPLAEIGRIAREKDVLLHTDAIQTFGKLPTRVDELGVDLLSLSAHKLYGPKGVGALYVRQGTRLDPLLHGGHHERNRRAGTENVAGIVGLGRAAELALTEMEEEAGRLASLRERLWHGIVANVEGVRRNGHPTQALPGTLNACFEYIEGESIVLGLDMKGIAVSSGSACTSGALDPSHVLLAMGLEPGIAQGAVRFSLGRENTVEQVETVVAALQGVIKPLQVMMAS
ncbi:MAG TPA: cysteine desulfurase NifS [Anaerolineae bacterium]|nr:cysteine desulfurase NifS [Anaerolineae bacterium]